MVAKEAPEGISENLASFFEGVSTGEGVQSLGDTFPRFF
jgi:hypothetical protein